MDGQTKVTNKTLQTLLRALIKFNTKAWDLFLSHAEFSYNNALNKTMGMSQFKVVYGIDPLSSLDLVPGATDEEASKRVEEIQKLRDLVSTKEEKFNAFYQA